MSQVLQFCQISQEKSNWAVIALGDLHERKNKVSRSGFASDSHPLILRLILQHSFTQKGKNILILKAYQDIKNSLLSPSQINKFTFQECMSFEENKKPPIRQKTIYSLGNFGAYRYALHCPEVYQRAFWVILTVVDISSPWPCSNSSLSVHATSVVAYSAKNQGIG